MKANHRRRNLRSILAEEPAIAIPYEFEQAFRTQHGMVFRTAYRITGNSADAEDVLQTVFLRLLRRRFGADGIENEESYLRRAAVNASLDVIRARQSDRVIGLPELAEQPAHNSADDAGPALRRALVRAIAQLKPRQAEVFVLRFIEGLSHPQIARMLGISQVSVAVIVYRTRQQLRKELSSFLGDRS